MSCVSVILIGLLSQRVTMKKLEGVFPFSGRAVTHPTGLLVCVAQLLANDCLSFASVAFWTLLPDRSFKLNDRRNIPPGVPCLPLSAACFASGPCVRFSIDTLRACSYLRAGLRVFTQAAFAFSVQSLDKLNDSSSCSF